MSQILQKVREVDPNDSDAVKEVVTLFFQNLLKHTEVNCNIWLRVLEDIITRFPRYCSQHRPTIENYLTHFLDSNNYNNVVEAAKCTHGLQQIRPSQDKTATPKNCWREQMNILCDTAHTLIEAIFSKTVNIYKNSGNVKKNNVELLANTPFTLACSRILNVKKSQTFSAQEKKMVLCNKLRNIFVYIQAMLVEVYPVAKPIQPQLILEVVVQALSVSSSVITDAAEAAIVKIQALRTLDALVYCLGPNLIPFSGLVFRFVMQTLRWSSENPSKESREVRVGAYNSLNKWLSTLHVHHVHQVSSHARGRSWEDELTKHVIEDITPAKKIVQLTMSNEYTKKLSKKAKRKLANTMLKQSTIASHMPGEKNKENVSEESSDKVANAALECGETFLTVSGIFLKPTTHRMFQERLVRECYDLDNYSVERSLCLLRALDAARKNTPPSVPPPTQYCVQLYSTLVNSPYDEIRKLCSQALLDIRLHLHCSPPSINFALEVQDTKTVKNKRKEISKKNREALESLLGKDRMPPETIVEGTLSEPMTKKPRLEGEEDIADRISISSESEDSVLISDDSEVEEVVEDNDKEVEVVPEKEDTIDSNLKTSTDTEKTMDSNIESVENVVDTTEADPDREIESVTPTMASNIYEAQTQFPINTSDTVDGDKSPTSMEIAYDVPNVANTVTVLEKMDDENLPSTSDTDDVQITCGQIAVSSQESDSTKDICEVEKEISTVKSNAINKDAEENEAVEVIENGVKETRDTIEVKITSKEVTVEDMLADFVDEVNEEPSLVA